MKPRPSTSELGPFFDAGLDEVLHALQRGARDERAEIGLFVRVGRHFQALHPRDKLLDEPVRGLLADRNGHRDRHAAFARRAVARAHKRVHGLVHVGVGHHDHVVLGAAESLHALSVRRAGSE